MKIDPKTLRDVAASLSGAAADVGALYVSDISGKVGDTRLSATVSQFEEAWRCERDSLRVYLASMARALAGAADLLAGSDGDVAGVLATALSPRLVAGNLWRRAV